MLPERPNPRITPEAAIRVAALFQENRHRAAKQAAAEVPAAEPPGPIAQKIAQNIMAHRQATQRGFTLR